MRHKPCGDLQFLPMPIYCWKDFSMDFIMGLSILTNWKRESYNSTLVIIDRLTKMVHYEPIKVTIDTLALAKVILNVLV